MSHDVEKCIRDMVSMGLWCSLFPAISLSGITYADTPLHFLTRITTNLCSRYSTPPRPPVQHTWCTWYTHIFYKRIYTHRHNATLCWTTTSPSCPLRIKQNTTPLHRRGKFATLTRHDMQDKSHIHTQYEICWSLLSPGCRSTIPSHVSICPFIHPPVRPSDPIHQTNNLSVTRSPVHKPAHPSMSPHTHLMKFVVNF